VSLRSSVLWCVIAGSAGTAAACSGGVQVQDELVDDAQQYIDDVDYRRAIVERDLTDRENEYARTRLALYGVAGSGWEELPERDPRARPLRASELASLEAGAPFSLAPGEGESLLPAVMPATDAEWVALGRRVFFEHPFRADGVYEAVVRLPGALDDSGFLIDGDTVVGLAVFEDETGTRLGPTCAQCHAGRIDGEVTAVVANKGMDMGTARLLAMGITPEELPEEIDSTVVADLHRLGPGRTDVLGDGVFNPFAIPDFGGIADFPYLQHNANWVNRGVATLAVRCETLFITSNGGQTRIPRVLSWALAMYLRSLPPPPPRDAVPAAAAARGKELFASATCAGCHVPPLFTSDREVTIAEVGTDPAALESDSRGTGFVRIPSLRGVGNTAPYFHHGAVPDLETLFDPAREEPGHPFGLELDADDRAALIAYLRSI
jgi:mono/diheme cytochrome c family protein